MESTLTWTKTPKGYRAEGTWQSFEIHRLTGSWVLYGHGNGTPQPSGFAVPGYARREGTALTLSAVMLIAEARNGNREASMALRRGRRA